MGSGSSKSSQPPKSKAAQPVGSSKSEDSDRKLPGSSTPPKGLPRKPQGQGQASKPTENVANAKRETNGNVVQKRPVSTKGPGRQKSVVMESMARKSIVRQMERGINNDESLDAMLGLDRMKTKMMMKKEKTLMRSMLKDETGDTPLGRFKKASKKANPHPTELPRGEVSELYMGNMNVSCPPTSKIVRIFTSSTFTDTMHERNKLMVDAYPRIKTFCQELGYDFQVVDMRWGIRDQATDDHMGTDMCLKEMRACQEMSTGPNFVSLMSHKYGYTDFPRSIEATEFEKLRENIKSEEVLALFSKWYKKDSNAVPPAYILSPVSSHIPDFISTTKEKKDAAKKQWWAESELMQTTLEEVATQIFDVETARKYTRSVTETEVSNGLLSSTDPALQCIWLQRVIEDLDTQDASYLVSRYTECIHNNSPEKVEKSHRMLKELKEKMTKCVAQNTLQYKVKWNKNKGVDPDDATHKRYLENLTKDFISIMCKMITSAVEQRRQLGDSLLQEVVQHTQFCQTKCSTFYGREDVLQRIKDYIDNLSDQPLVLYSSSGSGKTSLMAMAAKKSWDWMKGKGTVITRFIGTTPGSSTLRGLLSSITLQIRKAYRMSWDVSSDLRTLIEEFHMSLLMASNTQPLVLVIDSLDSLDPSHNARQLQWLPIKLRPFVKIIVSTLPEEQYKAFPVLKTTIKTEANFIEVPTLQQKDVNDILNHWLSQKQRTLTEDQQTVVLNAFKKCPIPLFLKLAFDTASSWTSYAPKSQTVLQSTVRASIDKLFESLENVHGNIFVSRALGYLTTAKSGLTETELEDILSCDDDVLNDVYMYWTPPVRRLPPLLLVRLRSDLSQYLVDRGADNVRVTYWYHRQFQEAALARYCRDKEVTQTLHTALADFFVGTWADGTKKPFTSNKGEKGTANRHVTSQPNMFGNAYNLRKLNNLPYHRCHSNQPDLLKKDCLCNFEFILTKLKATSLWQIMDDFALAKHHFPNDEQIQGIDDALRLSQEGLLNDANQLVPQLVGRLPSNKNTSKFLQSCLDSKLHNILPDKRILTQPGGQLLHSMAGHKGDIHSLDINSDSSIALTCADDDSVRFWNISNGQQVQVYDSFGKVSKALFCNNDSYILIVRNDGIGVRTAETGEKVQELNAVCDDFPLCLTGKDKSTLIVFKNQTAMMFDLTNGTNDFNVELSGSVEFKHPGYAVGSNNLAAVTTSDQVFLTVFDTRKKQFSSLIRGFEPFTDEELGDQIQYEIDEMTITTDEKCVIYSNIYTNDIVFWDVKSKQKIRTIKGNPNDYVRSLKCTPDGKFLYLVRSVLVNFLDIKTGKITEELEHTADLISACTNDMKTVVTVAEDSNVRVWDRTRKVQSLSLTPGILANRIRLIRNHDNARYIIGFGFKTRENDSQFIFVYDIVKHCTVRERLLDCSILQIEMINEHEMLVLHDVEQKLKVIDINTLKVVREFQGYLPSRNNRFHVINTREEVACFSHGRHNVKVYNMKTGKVSAIIDSGQNTQPLEGLCVSKNGKVLAAYSGEPVNIYVFDLANRKLQKKFTPKNTFFSDDDMALTPDGKLLLFKTEGLPQKCTGEEVVFLEVWDSSKGSKMCELFDTEYQNRYIMDKETDISAAVDCFEVLDNNQVLVACDDYILRVFNTAKGELLHRLEGHRTGIEIVYNADCPYVLTYGSWTEENTLRLWDRREFKCVATYTLDRSVTNLHYNSNGKLILASLGKPAEIVTWKFHQFGNEMTFDAKTSPEIFKGEDLKGYLDLVPEDDDMKIMPDDPDRDIADDSSDDDDDFM